MSSCTGVRIGLLSILALLGTALTITEVRSQPRPPGMTGPPRPPTMPGRPPGFGSPPSMPRPPGFGSPPSMPNFPTMPSRPRTPRGGGASITVWVCGRCDAELGTGPIKPSIATCPHCGARFRNEGGGGFDSGLGFTPPPSSPPAFSDPDLPQRPGGSTFGGGSTAPGAFAPPTSSQSDSPSSDESSTKPMSTTGKWVLRIMIGVFGLLFVLAILGGIALFVMANRTTPAKKRLRRQPRPLELDDE